MKKLAYQTPAVKVTGFYMEQQIAAGSGAIGTGDVQIGWGGDDDGTHDPDSKTNIETHSVWED